MPGERTPHEALLDAPIQQVFAALPAAAYACDASGVVRLWTPAAAALWGDAPDRGPRAPLFCGAHALFAADGTPLPPAEGPVAQALRTGGTQQATVVIERPDGTRVATALRAVPLHDGAGALTGVIAMLDPAAATDAVAADDREARYRAVVEDQPDLVCRFLADSTLTFANEAYCRFFGFDRDRVIGTPYAPIVHPEDLPAVQALVATLSPENPVVLIENRVRRADGEVRWTQWTNRAIYDERRTLVELQSAGRDITERRQAEEDAARLAAIVTSAESAIFSMSLDGVIRSWNHAAERMFGYAAHEAIGQSVEIVIPADRRVEGAEILGRLQRGETVDHLETERIARDGRRIPVSLSVSPMVDAAGRIIGISKIARDITGRLEARRELEARESRIRSILEGISDAFSAVDREWRFTYVNDHFTRLVGRPRAALLGRICWEVIGETQREALYDVAHRAVAGQQPGRVDRFEPSLDRWLETRLYPMPDGLIAFTADITDRKRLEAAWAAAVERETEARAAAEEASRLKDEFLAVVSHELRTPLNAILGWARMLREGSVAPPSAPRALETIERNARVQAQLVEDLLDVSRIVSGKLRLQVEATDLPSVVDAALEVVRPAAAAKQIDLRFEASGAPAVVGDAGRLQQAIWNLLTNAIKFTPPGGRVSVGLRQEGIEAVVDVCDTGAGIPRDVLPFIFDRFRQADSRTTRVHGGLGLGLTIVAYVAEAHGGHVEARSDGPGQGATFEFRLPAAPAGARPLLRVRDAALPDLRGRHVLIVDDEADARDLARAVLERSGAQVTVAASTLEALGRIEAVRPDLLVGDIGMPEHDGYELLARVRALPGFERLPAIALTAYAGPLHRETARAAGYEQYLVKPVDPDALCSAVAVLCRPRDAGSGPALR